MSGPRLYLAGLSGAGKTTLAALLGRWLGVRIADVDAEIERAAGRSVAELWSAGGESAFRALERETVERLVAGDDAAVIALGGGTLEDAGSRERLARWGEGVWLDAPAPVLAARVADGIGRPLLASGAPEPALRALEAERRPRYEVLPHRVAVHGPTAVAAAVAVLRAVDAGALEELGAGIRFGRGALGRAADLLAGSFAVPTRDGAHGPPAGPLPVVTDGRVWGLHGSPLAESLRSIDRDAVPIELEEGEAGKSPAALLQVWRSLAAVEAGRDAPLAVLGGGALGDVGGLAAATFKRGLPLALFPTTLLAQVDAAIGGKNAIDLDGIKNAVGTFHEPALVAIDPLCPLTQDGREWRAGWAEIVKSGLVGDPELFDLCEREVEGIGERRLAVVEEATRRAARVKLRIVAADPRDAGPRRALNLGHTLGHAIEAAADGTLLHGEAVAIGLVLAARLSERERVAEAGLAERIEAVLAALELPVRPPAGLDPGRVLALARQDKKRRGDAIHAVLPARPGAVEIRPLDDAALERWIGRALESDFVRAGSSR